MFLKSLRVILLLILYILFHLVYLYGVSKYFSYEGFVTSGFKEEQLLYHSIIIVILVILQLFMKNAFYNLVYNIFLILIVFGQSIVSMYIGSNILFYYIIIPQLMLFILDILDRNNFKIYRKQFNIENKYFNIFSLLLAIIIIVPFLKNIGSINLSNLLFAEIYDSRSGNKGSYGTIINYLYSSIARVIFPFLLIYFWMKKKYLSSLIIFGFIILLFLLNGAVKSILIGAFAAIVFYFFKYSIKNLGFVFGITIMFIMSLIESNIFNSYKIADYLRRIFYLPGYLFDIYQQEFSGNLTYYGQTLLGTIFGYKFDDNIAAYIGEKVLGRPGMVANVGIFAEGYISLGLLGVIIASLLFILIIFLLKSLDLKPQFFGLIFTYLYVINTAFIQTLFITHGLLFLIIFAYFFIPTNYNSRKKVDLND